MQRDNEAPGGEDDEDGDRGASQDQLINFNAELQERVLTTLQFIISNSNDRRRPPCPFWPWDRVSRGSDRSSPIFLTSARAVSERS